MVHARDREAACSKMASVLHETTLQGPPTNIYFLADVISSKCRYCHLQLHMIPADNREAFLDGDTLTNFLETKFRYEPCAIDVLSPGSFTTVQDFPARATSGHGIPKGGPMDNLASRSMPVVLSSTGLLIDFVY
jgi:urea carboxylase